MGGAAPLVPGSIVEVVVTKAGDKRLVRVTTNREAVAGAVAKEWKGLTIGEPPSALSAFWPEQCTLTWLWIGIRSPQLVTHVGHTEGGLNPEP